MATNPHSYLNKAAINMAGVTGIDAAGELDIAELTDGTAALEDEFAFNDKGDGASYRETFQDLFALVAGTVTSTALTEVDGVMSVSPGGATAKTAPVSADSALIRDSQASNVNKSVTLANLTKALSPNALTTKAGPVPADELILGDTEASNVAKKVSITNLTKAVGEVAAGTNAGSALSEADGVMRVNINGTTEKTGPVAADSILVNDSEASNVNKKASFTNVQKMLGEIAAGTNATSGLSETDGVLRTNIHGVTEKTSIKMADEVLLGDSDAANVNKRATLTNVQKILGETFTGSSATSSLSETDGVGKVDIGSTTATTAPKPADEMLIEVGGVNKSTTLTNVTKAIGEVAAGSIATSGLSETDGVLMVRPLGCTAKTTAVDADGILLGDSAASSVPKTLTWANLKTQLGTDMAGTGLTSSAGVLATQDPGAIAVGSCLFGATGDCTSVSVGAETFTHDETPVVADGEWAYGASASESATNLAAAINGKTASPYTAIADGDTVLIMAEAVGTAGNVTVTRTGGAQPATLENLVGGLAAATKQQCIVAHTVTANEVDTAVLVEVPVPFTPTMFTAQIRSATGLVKGGVTDLFTIGASPDRIVLTGDGATHVVATDVITVQAFE